MTIAIDPQNALITFGAIVAIAIALSARRVPVRSTATKAVAEG